jgi:hypothetical protein
MKYEEYQEFYINALRLDDDFEPVEIPIESLPDEAPGNTFLRFLIDKGFIEMRGDKVRLGNRQKIKDYNPNLLKILDAICMSATMAELDDWHDKGYIIMSVDDDGDVIYQLTEEGKKHIDN